MYFFRNSLQLRQPRRPIKPVGLKPAIDFRKPLGLKGIKPLLRVPPLLKKPCLPQNPNMARDRRSADRKPVGDFTGAKLARPQVIKDRPSCGVGDGGEGRAVGSDFFCNHSVK